MSLITTSTAERTLDGVRAGAEAATEDLVISHQDGVYSYALSIVGDHRDAEEVAQDTFVRAIRAIRTQYTDEQLASLLIRPWLLRITRNLALNRVRARKSRPRTDPIEPGLEIADSSNHELPAESHDAEQLRVGLEHLDPAAREWLELRFVNDLSYAEIAALRGGTEAAARGKVFRALAALRKLCSERKNHAV